MPTRTNFPSTASTPSPSLVDMLNAESITSFTMDAEIVAVDKDTGAYRTFQDLSNRAKKDVRVEDIKVIVGVYAFDLMSLNDTVSSAFPHNADHQPLLDSPFSHRRHLLRTLFPPFSNPSDPTLARFDHVESLDSAACTDPQAEIQVFFETVVEQKCEGLMVKLLESGEGITGEDDVDDEVQETPKKKKGGNGGKKKPLPATYEPDQRSQGWLKVKKGMFPLEMVADYQITLRASVILSIWCRLVLGGVKVGKQVGGVRSCLRVIIQRLVLWKQFASVGPTRYRLNFR